MLDDTLIVKNGTLKILIDDKPINRQINIQKNAKLFHFLIQNLNPTEQISSENIINLQENAYYETFILQTDAQKNNLKTVVNLLEKNSKTFIAGIYLADKKQKISMENIVNHLAENTVSEQQVRGIANDFAQTYFAGLINVAPNIKKVSGTQYHKALMLSETADVKCIPELAIASEDVKCSHGSTIGMLDENQIFYMQTRGIPLLDAQIILTKAFIFEILNKINDQNVLKNFTQKVETWLIKNMK